MIYTRPLVFKFVPGPPEAADGVFSGLASTWNIDRSGELIAPGAFQRSVEALTAGRQRIPVLLEHDPRRPAGAIHSAQETDAGLEVSGKLVLGDPGTDRAHQLLIARALGLSVGFTPRAGGASTVKGVKTYSDVDLMEISLVSMPANAQAVVHQVRSLDAISRTEFKSALLEGQALPPMPRRLVEKLAHVCFPTSDVDADDSLIDPAEAAEIQQALRGLTQIFKRK